MGDLLDADGLTSLTVLTSLQFDLRVWVSLTVLALPAVHFWSFSSPSGGFSHNLDLTIRPVLPSVIRNAGTRRTSHSTHFQCGITAHTSDEISRGGDPDLNMKYTHVPYRTCTPCRLLHGFWVPLCTEVRDDICHVRHHVYAQSHTR